MKIVQSQEHEQIPGEYSGNRLLGVKLGELPGAKMRFVKMGNNNLWKQTVKSKSLGDLWQTKSPWWTSLSSSL